MFVVFLFKANLMFSITKWRRFKKQKKSHFKITCGYIFVKTYKQNNLWNKEIDFVFMACILYWVFLFFIVSRQL